MAKHGPPLSMPKLGGADFARVWEVALGVVGPGKGVSFRRLFETRGDSQQIVGVPRLEACVALQEKPP
eukprot:CAMPEP_0202089240 /NCGR_PEP_ID=MMETSP0964-20121228/40666_1 /ASSEMBLY_ACC=CAM_ASM_000500 /TAXON_ID=4773 /ORGANISM="Schizochytrium aggregatum, Strain ATCC28209" /LENGTH=67 /DNA_ID=CAMNT_0048657307 /DNA_START=235 /DNA_END=434 /DNA_ORIENTATION=+